MSGNVQRKEANNNSKKHRVRACQEKGKLVYHPNGNSFHTYRSYRGL